MSNIKAVLVGYGLTPSVQLCFLEAAATRLKENGAVSGVMLSGYPLNTSLARVLAQPPISDKLAASMAYFHFRYGELGSFLSHVMVRELGGFGEANASMCDAPCSNMLNRRLLADDETVLFREASITTALLKMSFKMIPMVRHLEELCCPPLILTCQRCADKLLCAAASGRPAAGPRLT